MPRIQSKLVFVLCKYYCKFRNAPNLLKLGEFFHLGFMDFRTSTFMLLFSFFNYSVVVVHNNTCLFIPPCMYFKASVRCTVYRQQYTVHTLVCTLSLIFILFIHSGFSWNFNVILNLSFFNHTYKWFHYCSVYVTNASI